MIVETSHGKLEGKAEDGVMAWKGIPYARAPRGTERFRPPQPVEPWSGVRDASAFAASAPQSQMMLPLPGMDVGAQDEDCLFLNVWSPAADGERRPVLFWIHGGAFVIGSGSQPVYDGAALARRGDAVVVTINYRLGPLGFLFLADLCPELDGVTGNEGILDQIAALRFVRENAAAFGGDPENVTIFGESAGGMSVATLLGMPAAKGLFRRAIPQSGAAHNFHSRETATKTAAAFLEKLGLERSQAARLLEIPAQKLMDAQQQILFQMASTPGGLLPFQPVVDGDTLPQPPLEAVRDGAQAGTSLLVGTTKEEFRLFGMMDPEVRGGLAPEALVPKLATRIPGADVEALVAIYREAREARGEPSDPVALYQAIETDRIFRIPALRLAEAQAQHTAETFLYRFDHASPAFGGLLGACHAIELPFVFGTHHASGADLFVGAGPEVDRLAEQTMDAWLAFARTGDPCHDALPEPWPAWDTARRACCLLDDPTRVALDPDAPERHAWEGVL